MDRWSLLVIQTLETRGRTRFGTLREAIPDVSPKVLSGTLQRLQTLGLLHRFVHAEAPPRVEYKLTPAGAALAAALVPLVDWAQGRKGLTEPETPRDEGS